MKAAEKTLADKKRYINTGCIWTLNDGCKLPFKGGFEMYVHCLKGAEKSLESSDHSGSLISKSF